MLYAIEQRSRQQESVASEPGDLGAEITASLRATVQLLQTIAVENGVELPETLMDPEHLAAGLGMGQKAQLADQDAPAPERSTARLDELSSNLPATDRSLLRSAYQYTHLVREWFDSHASLFERKQDELDRRLLRGEPESAIRAEVSAIEQAVATIAWYPHPIFVKLARSCHSRDWAEKASSCREEHDALDCDHYRRDSDGSAKVALIGIKCSLEAWNALSATLPNESEGILILTESLRQLRSSVEQMFPQAWQFIRPGFDELPAG